eukprot:m.308898 g.308898  ORF g.308898 m.308898 type:complete len:651 (+) comp22003_c0_seq1:309-2261(+)
MQPPSKDNKMSEAWRAAGVTCTCAAALVGWYYTTLPAAVFEEVQQSFAGSFVLIHDVVRCLLLAVIIVRFLYPWNKPPEYVPSKPPSPSPTPDRSQTPRSSRKFSDASFTSTSPFVPVGRRCRSPRDSPLGIEDRLPSSTDFSGLTSPPSDDDEASAPWSDRAMRWLLSVGLATLWPRRSTESTADVMGQCGVIVMIFARCVAATLFLEVYSWLDSDDDVSHKLLLGARIAFQMWSVVFAIWAGRRYFDSELEQLDHRSPCDAGTETWRRLRSLGSPSMLNPHGLRLWSKLAFFLLVLLSVVEVKARRVMLQLHLTASVIPATFQRDGPISLVVGLWRDCISAPVILLRDALEHVHLAVMELYPGAVNPDPASQWIFYLATLLTTLFGVLILCRAVPLLRRGIVNLLTGLVSYFILVAIRRFSSALLSLVACIDLSHMESAIANFARPENLMRLTQSERAREFLRFKSEVARLNARLSPIIHFLVIDKLLHLITDVCGAGSGDRLCPDMKCSRDDEFCVGGYSSGYLWAQLAYYGRHAMSSGFILMMMWRASSVNHALHFSVHWNMHRARFMQTVRDGEDPKGRTIDQLEIIGWANFTEVESRLGGIHLFGYPIGRGQVLAWPLTWVLADGNLDFFAILAFFQGRLKTLL